MRSTVEFRYQSLGRILRQVFRLLRPCSALEGVRGVWAAGDYSNHDKGLLQIGV